MENFVCRASRAQIEVLYFGAAVVASSTELEPDSHWSGDRGRRYCDCHCEYSQFVNSTTISAALNIKYAEMHGYAFSISRHHGFQTYHHMEQSSRLMDMLTTRHEWIMWIDADAVVTNRNISIEGIIRPRELKN